VVELPPGYILDVFSHGPETTSAARGPSPCPNAASATATFTGASVIRHPDDMSGIILDSFCRHLNGNPIKLDEQVKHYQDYWKTLEEEREVPNSK
jgi:hypothetical protein